MAFYLAKIHIFSLLLAHLPSDRYCTFFERGESYTKIKTLCRCNKKTNQGHKVSQIKCKFSVHYLV